MITISDFSSIQNIGDDNQVFVNSNFSFLRNSKINFNGKNNILFVEDGVNLTGSVINFNGNNNVVYLKKSNRAYLVQISVNNNNTVFIGSNNYFNGILHIIASEEKNIIIGNDSLFSFDIWVRTADPHVVYSCDTHKRINASKSVFIGDHVWIGQSAFILKGSNIGSGSIIGAASVVAGKAIPSNTSYAGNPVKFIKDGVFYTSDCVHSWTTETSKQHEYFDSDMWIYQNDENTFKIDDLDTALTKSSNSQERLKIIKSTLAMDGNKNRFFIPSL